MQAMCQARPRARAQGFQAMGGGHPPNCRRRETLRVRWAGGRGSRLASSPPMRLEDLLDRCQALEQRTSAAYRRFATMSRTQPAVCALWTSLAREEEDHAQAVSDARADVRMR